MKKTLWTLTSAAALLCVAAMATAEAPVATGETAWLRGKPVATYTCAGKTVIPVSALAYEMIRLAARMGASLPGRILRAPGFLFQLLTTREPDREQLEVAVVALREALGDSAPEHMHTVSYTVLE